MKLGDKVRDRVTGINGTITEKTLRLHGGDDYKMEYIDNRGAINGVWGARSRFEEVVEE